MIVIGILVSVATGIYDLFFNDRISNFITYSLIDPVVVLMPRIFYSLKAGLRKKVKKDWVLNLERAGVLIILVNAPASLILHDLNFQYDRFLHFAVGFLVFWIALLLFMLFDKKGKAKNIFSTFTIVFALLFVWEGFQYLSDQFLGTAWFVDNGQPLSLDFWEDIIFGTLGAVLSAVVFGMRYKKVKGLFK